nr:immunoglobulin light chain junction region [Macaca mulatta]MOW59479.1 immunoglobulin light chain junction region [Macaca mulatta]MOW61640.1 immunoglobulin light chain junction region [Macaca mulatta]
DYHCCSYAGIYTWVF